MKKSNVKISNNSTHSLILMEELWEPQSIFTDDDFFEIHSHFLQEFFDGKEVSFYIERIEDDEVREEFTYEFTQRCRFPSNKNLTEYSVKLMFGKNFRPSPSAELRFYHDLKFHFDQDIGSLDDYLAQEIFENHWKLGDCWGRLRKLIPDGLEIIQNLKSFFIGDLSTSELPEYLSNYINNHRINLLGKNDYYFEYSPLLWTFEVIFKQEISLEGKPPDYRRFEYEEFLERFENTFSVTFREFLKENSNFDISSNNPLHKKNFIFQSLKNKGWILDAEPHVANYKMLILEVMYLCLIKSDNSNLIDPFDILVETM